MVGQMPNLTDDLRTEIAGTRWYHTLELPDGIVTSGEFDLRPAVSRVPLPTSLAGQRCLDVGTRDGFWAFEIERRGADEVVGIDVDDTAQHDWPTPRPVLPPEYRDALAASQRSFDVAKRALGSSVDRRDISVYDLTPEAVGQFDFAFLGTLLVHLRDPVGALTAVRRVLKSDATLVINEAISLSLTITRPRKPSASLMTLDAPFWWIPNRQALRRWVEAAGFVCQELGRPYLVDRGPAMDRPPLSRRNDLGGLARQLVLRAGMPHVALVARPVPDNTG